MTTKTTATFELKGWDEKALEDDETLPKVARATVTKEFSGDVEGEGLVEYLMAYAADGTARFVGLERIKGTVAGKKGSVVLQHVGAFEDGTARAKLTVIPGSGTQGLAGLTGDGEFSAARGPNGEMTLSVSFG